MRATSLITVCFFWWNAMLFSQADVHLSSQDTVQHSIAESDNLIHTKVEVREFSRDFRSKYKGDDFNYKEEIKEKGFFEKLLEKLFNPSNTNISETWATVIIWLIKAIVVVAGLYGVYILVTFLMGKQGNWLFTSRSDIKTVSYGTDEEDIIHNDFPALITASVAEGNYRMAVRYHYLYLLQMLIAKGFITYHKDKTNTEYRYEIKNKKLGEAFGYVSYIYDYTWYGAFEISRDHYKLASDAFEDTYKMSV